MDFQLLAHLITGVGSTTTMSFTCLSYPTSKVDGGDFVPAGEAELGSGERVKQTEPVRELATLTRACGTASKETWKGFSHIMLYCDRTVSNSIEKRSA